MIPILILSGLLAVSCAPAAHIHQVAEVSFIQRNLPDLIALEEKHEAVATTIQSTFWMLGGPENEDVPDAVDALNAIDDYYWLYYYAAHTYLSSGDKEAFDEALKRMDESMETAKAWFEKWYEEQQSKPPSLEQSF